MQDYILMLVAGVVLAWFGGEFFVKGGVGLARWARWPTAVIGVTVAAFGTSSPELLVAINAAVGGVPQISLGDVLGSNVVNIALVLALVLAMSGMKVEDDGMRRDWLIALLVPVVLYVLLADGWFSRLDASILMVGFVGWLIVVIRHARKNATTRTEPGERISLSKTIFFVALGLALLLGAAQLVVMGGRGVATELGWSPFVVGAVVVAAATGTPELATTIISRLRGHDDVGLGNILGSNIFNALFIAAVAALIHPYRVDLPEILPSLIFGVVTTLLILPAKNGELRRWRGFALLGVYALYITMTLQQNAAH